MDALLAPAGALESPTLTVKMIKEAEKQLEKAQEDTIQHYSTFVIGDDLVADQEAIAKAGQEILKASIDSYSDFIVGDPGDPVDISKGKVVSPGHFVSVDFGSSTTTTFVTFSSSTGQWVFHSPDLSITVPKPKQSFLTQKARGLRALMMHGLNTPTHEAYSASAILNNAEIVKSMVNKFLRPCPVQPRHGFVDSRVVESESQVKQVLEEALKADKDAEVIIMPYIKAPYSGIWTEGLLTIGPGTDGATAGKNSISIPILGHVAKDVWYSLKEAAGITEAPYAELLWQERMVQSGRVSTLQKAWRVLYVQLRNGPKLPQTRNYVPNKMEVKNVVLAEGDLLEWETKVKGLPEGSVVYHPGGSLASHYAVHSVLSKIPVVITFKPEIGQTLELESTIGTTNADVEKLRAGFVAGCKANISFVQAAHCMLAACHSTSFWVGKHDLLLGFALGCTYRLLVTACLGEFRYYRHKAIQVKNGSKVAVDSPGRDEVYFGVWNRILTEATRSRYIRATERFGDTTVWGTVCGVGGLRWMTLSAWAGLLYNSLVGGDTQEILQTFNKSINAVHNNGWAFNKFIPSTLMDVAAENPVASLLECAPAMYEASKTDVAEAKWFDGKSKFVVTKIHHLDSFKIQDNPVQWEIGDGKCECKEATCKFCFPNGSTCTCKAHTCDMCFPDGCQCKFKWCHDCGKPGCDRCYTGSRCGLYDFRGSYKCTMPSGHEGNHIMYYDGAIYKSWKQVVANKSPVAATTPAKVAPAATPASEIFSLNFHDIIEDLGNALGKPKTIEDKPAGVPKKKKLNPQPKSSEPDSNPNPPNPNPPNPNPPSPYQLVKSKIKGAQVRIWSGNLLHVQYKYHHDVTGSYQSTDVGFSDPKVFKEIAKHIENNWNSYSWGSGKPGYATLTPNENGDWMLGNFKIL